MKTFLAICFLLVTIPAQASLCTWQGGNRQGDVIETSVNFNDQGTHSFTWNLFIDGIVWNDYGVEPLWTSENCLHKCLPMRFPAHAPNVYIHVEVLGGNASGWHCSLNRTAIVGHDPAYDKSPIPPWKKQVALANANYLASAKQFFAAWLAACAVTPIPGLVCKTAAGMVFFIDHLEQEQRRFSQDPWDPLYIEPYEGLPQDMELAGLYDWYPTESAYLNELAVDIWASVWLGDFIYVAANRVSSCQLVENWDCADMQQERLDFGMREFGKWLYGAGVNLYGIAAELEINGYDSGLISQLREAAAWQQWAAGEYVQ